MSGLTNAMREVLNGRYYATLGSINGDGSIHMTPVWFLFQDDHLYVQSSSTSRKVKNIESRPEVTLMVDVRKLGSEKWVYAAGSARILHGEDARGINANILRRYLTESGLEDPRVGPVLAAGDDVTIAMAPKTWRSWDMKSLDEQFFGGILGQSPDKWFLPLDE